MRRFPMCALHLSHASPSVCAHACTRAQSVANTAKRALLIMLSVWYFGNPVTVWNAVGMATVVLGVAVYNHARIRFP